MTKLSALCPLLVLVACVENASDANVDVVLGDQSFAVQSNDRSATMSWDDQATVLTAGNRDLVFATADADGRWSVQPDTSALVGYGEMLAIGEKQAADQMQLPWRQKQESVANLCDTISTWVFHGSCLDCYTAAAEASPPNTVEQSRSCSLGKVWTTCSVTRCSHVEQIEEAPTY